MSLFRLLLYASPRKKTAIGHPEVCVTHNRVSNRSNLLDFPYTLPFHSVRSICTFVCVRALERKHKRKIKTENMNIFYIRQHEFYIMIDRNVKKAGREKI